MMNSNDKIEILRRVCLHPAWDFNKSYGCAFIETKMERVMRISMSSDEFHVSIFNVSLDSTVDVKPYKPYAEHYYVNMAEPDGIEQVQDFIWKFLEVVRREEGLDWML